MTDYFVEDETEAEKVSDDLPPLESDDQSGSKMEEVD